MFGQNKAEPVAVAAVEPAPVPEVVNNDVLDVIAAALGSAGLKSRRFWLAVAALVIVVAQYALGNVQGGVMLSDVVKTLAIYAASEASTDIARAIGGGMAAGKSKGP
jgi:hypothetical protein